MNSKNILYGPPEVDIPTHKSFAIFLIEVLKKGGNGIAQICGNTNEKISYNEILQKSINLAVALRNLGVNKGDVVSLCSENRFEFTITALAVVFVGAINAPVNVTYTHDEIQRAFNLAKPKYIFCTPSVAKNIKNITDKWKYVKSLILFGDDLLVPALLYNNMIRESVDIDTFRPTEVNGETDTMVILYSSGTTGLPKGVMLTHLNVLLEAFHFEDSGKNVPIMSIAPWYHAYGFVTHLSILSSNTTNVFLTRFNEIRFLQAIQDYKVAYTLLVPPIVVFLAKNPLVNKYDLSSLKVIRCGAAPLSKEIIAAVKKRIGVEQVYQVYGMTETLGVLADNSDGSKKGTIGCMKPGLAAKIVDMETGQPLGPNQPGEMCFKSMMIMKGYVDDPVATKNTFDKDGFLHTGDIGYYDEDQYFYIIDRLKELIKYKGYQVAPAELEAVLLQHSTVKECGVVGKPDEAAGELPLAFVVKQPNVQVTENDLVTYIASKVSKTKKLRGGVIFINQIPKSPSGKILRRELKALLNKHLTSKL